MRLAIAISAVSGYLLSPSEDRTSPVLILAIEIFEEQTLAKPICTAPTSAIAELVYLLANG
jgi:hypothetical protein